MELPLALATLLMLVQGQGGNGKWGWQSGAALWLILWDLTQMSGPSCADIGTWCWGWGDQGTFATCLSVLLGSFTQTLIRELY